MKRFLNHNYIFTPIITDAGMELDNAIRQLNAIEKEKILLSFTGAVTSEFLASVLQIIESKLNFMEVDGKTKKKVFYVLIECAQNLYHHIEEKNNYPLKVNEAFLVILKDNSNFIIKTGNYIDIESSEILSLRLDKINNLDKVGLKQLYLETLSDGNLSEKGTAGLGFIDIARKSENKLKYEFIPVDDKYKFFNLEIKI